MNPELRSTIAKKYLRGTGIEFGALHNPLPHDYKQCTVTYADRLTRNKALKKFPELHSITEKIVEPRFLIDFNRDDFSSLSSEEFDFYIANHLIEHLVNPIRFLQRISRIMKPGALLYLAVPDKNHTFDVNRVLTTREHLWQDFIDDVEKISIEHLNDYILNKTKAHIDSARRAWMYFENDKLPWNPLKRHKVYALHRERSIHVHVWSYMSFDAFLSWIISKINLDLDVIEQHDSVEGCGEMIYILRKRIGRTLTK